MTKSAVLLNSDVGHGVPVPPTLTLFRSASMNIYSPINPPPGFYIYAYISKQGIVYYIGKGKDRRAWHYRHNVTIPKDHSHIIIMESNLTEVGSLALERFYIRWYGRKDIDTGVLRNLTDGGEGVSGRKDTEETKQRKRNALKGRKGKPRSEETKNRIRSFRRGKKHSEKTKEKMREARSKQVFSDESKKKMSENSKGKNPWTGKSRPDHSEKMKIYWEKRRNECLM